MGRFPRISERLRTPAYGETAYAGNDVCASTSEAMVCWDTETGDGAKINRTGTEIFHQEVMRFTRTAGLVKQPLSVALSAPNPRQGGPFR